MLPPSDDDHDLDAEFLDLLDLERHARTASASMPTLLAAEGFSAEFEEDSTISRARRHGRRGLHARHAGVK